MKRTMEALDEALAAFIEDWLGWVLLLGLIALLAWWAK